MPLLALFGSAAAFHSPAFSPYRYLRSPSLSSPSTRLSTSPASPTVSSPISSPPPLLVREGSRSDVPALLHLIRELASVSGELDQCQMTEAVLATDGWPTEEERAGGKEKRFGSFFAEVYGEVVAYAVYFRIYSTREGVGIYLEDLYVRGFHRGNGVGTALVRAVEKVAEEEKCGWFWPGASVTGWHALL